MDFNGIITGAATFLIIGMCHPLVIKSEYYLGKKSWWAFLVIGIILGAVSIALTNRTLSTIFGPVHSHSSGESARSSNRRRGF